LTNWKEGAEMKKRVAIKRRRSKALINPFYKGQSKPFQINGNLFRKWMEKSKNA
jgi:hypothetical protein